MPFPPGALRPLPSTTAMAKTKMGNPQTLAHERETIKTLHNTANGSISHPPNRRDASNSVIDRPLDTKIGVEINQTYLLHATAVYSVCTEVDFYSSTRWGSGRPTPIIPPVCRLSVPAMDNKLTPGEGSNTEACCTGPLFQEINKQFARQQEPSRTYRQYESYRDTEYATTEEKKDRTERNT